MANNSDLDDVILSVMHGGITTREKLMAITSIRHRTWAVVRERLAVLTKRGSLVASKDGWRIA